MRSWVLVLVGACYAPSPSPGAPCAENRACPTGLVCALDGRCELAIGTSDADPDARPDAPDLTDAAGPPETCWAAWRSGAPVLSAPEVVAELATSDDEGDPALSGDGLAIYFTRGTTTAADIYRATRPTRASPFGRDDRRDRGRDGRRRRSGGLAGRARDPLHRRTFSAIGPLALNSSAFDGDAVLTRDGCELFFTSTRGGASRDLYRAVVTPQ